MKNITTIICFLLTFCFNAKAELLPENIAVLANSNSAQSIEVAKTYLTARKIPEENLIAIPISKDETITRTEYDKQVLLPVRELLKSRSIENKIRVITTIYGVPLKISSPEITAEDKEAGVIAQEALAKAKIEVEENISVAQKLAGEKQDGFVEVQEADMPIKFQDLINRALAKLSKLSGQELNNSQNELTQVIANIGGLSSIASILKPAGTAEQIAQSEKEINRMHSEIKTGSALITELEKSSKKEDLEKLFLTVRQIFGALGTVNFASKILSRSLYVDADSSFDSELSLLWWDKNSYPISSALPNPYYHKILKPEMLSSLVLPVMMTSRIDAPSADRCIKTIKETIEAEKDGLKGKVYIDTRGLKSESVDTLTKWDQDLKSLGWYLRDNTNFKVEIDIFPELIEEAKNSAFYIGWYQLRKYEGDFSFNPGALAWHIASEEAVSIHDKEEKGWCKNLLEKGAAVSIGAVAEPYLESFPAPKEFTGLLLSGKYSLVEAYYLTTRNISWRLVLFGDPLYKPFKANKEIKAKDFNLDDFPIAPSDLSIKRI